MAFGGSIRATDAALAAAIGTIMYLPRKHVCVTAALYNVNLHDMGKEIMLTVSAILGSPAPVELCSIHVPNGTITMISFIEVLWGSLLMFFTKF